MKKLIFIAFILSAACCYAQLPTLEWVRRFIGNSFASGLSVKLDSSNNVYVLMSLVNNITNSGDFGLAKYSTTGNLIWNTFYNSPGNLDDTPYAFAVTPQGDVYITGTYNIGFNNHIATVKFDSSGALQWARTFDGGGPGDLANDVSLDKSGNIIIIGGSAVNSSLSYGLTIKYTPSGDSLWVRKFTLFPLYSFCEKIAIDDSNNIFITGNINMNNGDYLILKYNSNGNLMWYTTYNSPQNYSEGGYGIDLDSMQNIYVIGRNSVPSSLSNNTLIRVNSVGTIQWSRTFTGIIPGNGHCWIPRGIKVTPDGNSIYYTTSCDNGSSYEIVTLKYNSAGDSQWVRRHGGGISYAESNEPHNIKLDKFGNVYVVGVGYYTATNKDYVLIKYLSNGVQQWIATYNGPLSSGEDHAHDLYIDTSLNVYVTGMSSRQTTPVFLWDAATIKYSQPIGIVPNNNEIPITYKLYQNYPNPFNPTTNFEFQIAKVGFVTLKIYDMLGRELITLVNEELKAGTYKADWNAENYPSGIYFAVMFAGGKKFTNKMVLIK